MQTINPTLSLQADCNGWDHLMMRVPFGHVDNMDDFWVTVYSGPGEIAGHIRFEWVTDLAGERAFLARELCSAVAEGPHPAPVLEGASSLLPKGFEWTVTV